MIFLDALLRCAVLLFDGGEMSPVLEIMEARFGLNWFIGRREPVRELELMHKRSTERAFVTLASKDDHLVSHLIIGHPEIVPSRLIREEP